jgi:pimeloyl-ACP methyl ester carboxylesterase
LIFEDGDEDDEEDDPWSSPCVVRTGRSLLLSPSDGDCRKVAGAAVQNLLGMRPLSRLPALFLLLLLLTITASSVGAQDGARPPVLMVHGLWSSAGVWEGLSLRLSQPGVEAEAIDFTRSAGSNAAAVSKEAEALGRRIGAILRREGSEELDLVCHSLGGLAARWYLHHPRLWPRDADGERRPGVRKLILLGTPNWGADVFLADPVGAITVAKLLSPRGSDRYDHWSPAVRDMFASWMPPPVPIGDFAFGYSASFSPRLARWPSSGQRFLSPIDASSRETAAGILSLPKNRRFLPTAALREIRRAAGAFGPFETHRRFYVRESRSLGPVRFPPASSLVEGVTTRRISMLLMELNVLTHDTSGAQVYLLAGAAASRTLVDRTVAGLPVLLVTPYPESWSDTIVPLDSALGIDPITGQHLFPDEARTRILDVAHGDMPGDAAVQDQVLAWLDE